MNNGGPFLWSLTYYQNGQKSDSFAAHLKQNFNNLHKYMTLKVLTQLNPIRDIKTFTKTNWGLCMEERLTIRKRMR